MWDRVSITSYEELRARRRKTNGGRLSFDCANLKVIPHGLVSCSKGHNISDHNAGTLLLSTALQGFTAHICKHCPDFDDMGGDE